MAMEIVADKATKAMLPLPLMAPYRLAEVAMERGLLIYAWRTSKGMFGDWLMIAPPLITTEAEIDEIADLLAKSVSAYEAELSRARVTGVTRHAAVLPHRRCCPGKREPRGLALAHGPGRSRPAIVAATRPLRIRQAAASAR
jgi:hypothetical protein